MVVLFSTPKPFRDHIRTIQYNAIRSWTKLGPETSVLLLGDEEGCREAAGNIGVNHVSRIAKNEYGTPLVSDLFAVARMHSRARYLCYINADIVLTSSFIEAFHRIRRRYRSFLTVGRRWDIDQTEEIVFGAGWAEELFGRARSTGRLHEATGIDYFLFSRDVLVTIPPFAIGRTAWDNWLIYSARNDGVPVIDATRSIVAIHQNHDYSHLARGEADAFKGPESVRNLELAGGYPHCFTILDATRIMSDRVFLPPFRWKNLKRLATTWIIMHEKIFEIVHRVRRSLFTN